MLTSDRAQDMLLLDGIKVSYKNCIVFSHLKNIVIFIENTEEYATLWEAEHHG